MCSVGRLSFCLKFYKSSQPWPPTITMAFPGRGVAVVVGCTANCGFVTRALPWYSVVRSAAYTGIPLATSPGTDISPGSVSALAPGFLSLFWTIFGAPTIRGRQNDVKETQNSPRKRHVIVQAEVMLVKLLLSTRFYIPIHSHTALPTWWRLLDNKFNY